MKKNFLKLGIGLLVIGASILTACTKEGPMGPAGPGGTNGTNGSDGRDGVDANTVCLTCHTSANMNAKQAEYQFSKHFLGTTSARFGKYCARCHTNEGFQEVTSNGQFVVSNDIPNATRISCATCHKHSSFDFNPDTASFVLRVTEPVSLNYYNNSKTEDFGEINNLCCTCHQIRGATTYVVTDTAGVVNKTFVQLPYFPLDNTKENTTVKYQVGQSISVHDGNQSNLFKGINGYEYAGKSYTRTWVHSTNDCVDCHMNEYDPITNKGGHTLNVNEAKCLECHSGSDKIGTVQAAIDAKRIELGEALVAKKLFKKTVNATTGVVSYSAVQSHDYYGNLFPTTASTQRFGISISSANTVSPTTGLVIYGNLVKAGTDPDFALRIGREWTYGELGAAYNYGFINSELSKGVHNPTYAMQLLQNSIDYLNSR